MKTPDISEECDNSSTDRKTSIEVKPEYLEMIGNIGAAILLFSDKMKPLIKSIQILSDIVQRIFDYPRINAINKLKSAQYVCWDYLTDEMVRQILLFDDINSYLIKINKSHRYRRSKATIRLCLESNLAKPTYSLFEQSIQAYCEGQYDLSSVGLLSTIDSALSIASSNPTHKAKPRCDSLIEKIRDNSELSNEEYSLATLLITFEGTKETLYAFKEFTETEPDCMNRNWIVHGRSRKPQTRLDCIKLINFLYGIILIDKLNQDRNEPA